MLVCVCGACLRNCSLYLFCIGSRCSICGRELVPCSGSVRGQQLNLGFRPDATTPFICSAYSHLEPPPGYWEHMHCDTWMQWYVPTICLCACGSLISKHEYEHVYMCVVYIRSFDVQEVSLIYKESTHGGDKRKTNQHCAPAKTVC